MGANSPNNFAAIMAYSLFNESHGDEDTPEIKIDLDSPTDINTNATR